MHTSESIKQIAPALLNAQVAIKAALKDSTNPHFKSKYADLSSVIDAVKAPLNSQSILFTQGVSGADNGVTVETRLIHTSGEWIASALTVPVSKLDAQGVGSAITYGRRYGLQSLCGVPAEDDDGNAASAAPPPPVQADPDGKKLLEGASTLDELADIWRTLKPQQRSTLGPVKDAMKAKILKQEEATQP